MNKVETRLVELVGGPRDGERVQLAFFIVEFQSMRLGRPMDVWRETIEQTKDGAVIFRWEGPK